IDLERSLAALDVEARGGALDAHHLPDQLRQVSDRAAELASPDVQERLMLLGRRLVVHVDDRLPVALEDVAGDVNQGREGEARDIQAVHRASIDVPGQHTVTRPIVRVLADPARAEDVAGTDLQQSTIQLVRHRVPSLYWDDLVALQK